ncbi:MAG: hypothetical protein ABIR47_08730 [Candidatus Kapaibacterium sp.]
MISRGESRRSAQRFGGTYEAEPRIVCELAFDFIRKNQRTEAGYTLGAPRIRRIRWDLGSEEANTLADIERLYREDMEGREGSGDAIHIPTR